MSENAAPSLGNEVTGAAVGLARLIAHREDWAQGFDFSAKGFVRSFLAQLAALPFYLITAVLVARVSSPASGVITIWAAGLAHLLDAFGFPLLLALIARPLRVGPGFAAFVIVTNWASLIFNAVIAASAFLALLGREGFAVFVTFALTFFFFSIFVTWRAARETLTHELSVALLVVVLSVAFGVGVDQAAGWLVGLFN